MTSRWRGPATAVGAAMVATILAVAGCTTARQSDLALRPSSATTAPIDPTVLDLMDGAGMTPAARRLFAAAAPTLEDKATLADSCAGVVAPSVGTAHTYGCVVRGKVHVRSFSAPELHDMIYVVAAHELLHVVYAQMGRAEKVRIDAELQTARAGNAVLEERLGVYSVSAEDTPNEVHSVLGTEFGGLSAALEAHFAQYIDRGLVVAAYRRTLGDREDEILRLQASVDEMKDRLDSMSADMEALRAAGDLRTFNARVPMYNALVREHNAALEQLQTRVAAHKELIAS